MSNLVVRDPHNDHQYWLSGIAQRNGLIAYDYETAFMVPRDRDAAVLGEPHPHPKWNRLQQVFLAEDLQKSSYFRWLTHRRPQLHGYPVHARCWSLIERIIGSDAERHLELFMEALRRRFHKRINPPRRWFPNGGFPYPYLRYYLLITDKTRYLYRDPIRIPAIENLLKTATIIRKKPRRLPRRHHRPGNSTRQEDSTLRRGPFGTDLPLDIQYLVLDQLDGRDIAALHAAFTGRFKWRVSDLYWSRRAPRALIYEIQDLLDNPPDNSNNKSADIDIEIDWEYLCLHAEELVRTSEDVRNRQRLMRMIESTQKVFHQMLPKKDDLDGQNGDDKEVNYYYDESDCDETGYDGYCLWLNW
ncbi:hypothetical protein VTN77DRAFT_6746 [Rasamsonia byssochlamydoides]|uniref:uncharacterized protein n=1 Tax=Rasamsonia byssochlamydoides TaxID=89139 RepID=UPI003742E108